MFGLHKIDLSRVRGLRDRVEEERSVPRRLCVSRVDAVGIAISLKALTMFIVSYSWFAVLFYRGGGDYDREKIAAGGTLVHFCTSRPLPNVDRSSRTPAATACGF